MPQFRVEQPFPVGQSLVPVGRVKLPQTFAVHVTEHDDGTPDVELVFEVRNGVPECREVHMRATTQGHEVRYSGLAGVRVEDVLELALKELMGVSVDGEQLARVGTDRSQVTPGDRAVIRQIRDARRARKVTITDELLQEVAKVYRAHVEEHPTTAVAEHFDKSHRTAALYVKRARERGFLGAAIKGKAGEQ